MHESTRRALCVTLDREDCNVIDTLRGENCRLRQRNSLMVAALCYQPFIRLIQRIEQATEGGGLEFSFNPDSHLFIGMTYEKFETFIPVLNSMHYRICTFNVPEPRSAFVYWTSQIGPRNELYHRAVTEYMPHNMSHLVPVPM